MEPELVFYTHPMSRGRMVRWLLEELGVPYRTEVLDYGAGMKAPAYLAINPMGKVPAIRHGQVVVTECAAICAYLADAFPAAGLAPPPGSTARGAYYRWLFFGAGPVEAAVCDGAMGVQVPADKQAMVGYGCMADVLATLEQAMPREGWLAGDRFSVADLYLGAQLGWGMEYGLVEKRPVFEAYWDRMKDRPANKRAEAIDDALIAAMPQQG